MSPTANKIFAAHLHRGLDTRSFHMSVIKSALLRIHTGQGWVFILMGTPFSQSHAKMGCVKEGRGADVLWWYRPGTQVCWGKMKKRAKT